MTVEQILNAMIDIEECVEVRYYLNQDEWKAFRDVERKSMRHVIMTTPKGIIQNDIRRFMLDKECDMITIRNGMIIIVGSDAVNYNPSMGVNHILSLLENDTQVHIKHHNCAYKIDITQSIRGLASNIKNNLHGRFTNILESECCKIYHDDNMIMIEATDLK